MGSSESPAERAEGPGQEVTRGAWEDVRARLEDLGFHPSRRLGQNFLLDENMVRAIVRDAGVGPGDFVLEIGPGCGFLSLHLADAGARLLCVEIDRRLEEVTREVLAPYPETEVLRADALAGKHELAAEVRERLPVAGPWHLVSNLPYAVASPLMAVLGRLDNPPQSMTALVQSEVAERLAARPGSSDWGPLGIKLGLGYEATRVRTVPAGLFWPRPRVESAVVRLVRRAEAPASEVAEQFDALVDGLFQRRRKTLRAALGGLLGDRDEALRRLEQAGLDPSGRAEDLELEQLLALSRV